MKRAERRHLKQNELVTTVSRAREVYESHQRQITGGAMALILVVAAVVAVGAWQQYARHASNDLLARALERYHGPSSASTNPTPPLPDRATLEDSLTRFTQIAQSYRSQPAGFTAEYYQGITLVALRRTDEGRKVLADVMGRDRASLFGTLARMALADLDAQQARWSSAIETYKELSGDPKARVPVDAVLYRLGRAYQQSGNAAEAERTYTRLLGEYPSSPYVQEAQRELSVLKPGSAGSAS